MHLKLFKFLSDENTLSRADWLKIIIGSVIAGGAQALILVILGGAAGAQDTDFLNIRFLVLFLLCIAIFITMKRYVIYETTKLTLNVVYNYRVRIASKIGRSSLKGFEKLGQAYVITTLSEKSETIVKGSRYLVESGTGMVMLVFSFLHMALISTSAFLLSIGFVIAGMLHYLSFSKVVPNFLNEQVNREQEYFDAFYHLLYGFKEVKINQEKQEDLLKNYLNVIALDARNLKSQTERYFINLVIYGQIFFFLLMAANVFVLPQITTLSPEHITQITAIVLFIIGPLGTLTDSFASISKANIAIETLQSLETDLDEINDTVHHVDQNPFPPQKAFQMLQMKQVYFLYPSRDGEQGSEFSVGPLDFEVSRGETLFIIGGNGSGKSTFMKMLTGLYQPLSGRTTLDHIEVNSENYVFYRDYFSIIFTDFHLFDRLYGLKSVDLTKLNALLEEMKLDEKTKFRDNQFTNIELSTGQKKRLALIIAIMEDKPLYVFDEVAADQDPHFRRYFYQTVLKELKQQGKTVIVVTHDDHFFHLADRVLKMDDGKLLAVSKETSIFAEEE